MKTTRFAAIAGVILSTTAARAEEASGPNVQGAQFSSTAPPAVIAAAACSIHAGLTIEGKPRRVDVRFDGRRCAETQAAEDAVPVNVRIADGHVVVEGAAQDVPPDVMRPIVVALAREVRGRIERATPAPVVVAAPQLPVRYTPYDWNEQPEMKLRSPAMMGFGIASMALGNALFFGGLGQLLSNSYTASGGAGWMFAGVVLGAAVGMPLFFLGKKKVPRLTANVAPTGGSLRFAF